MNTMIKTVTTEVLKRVGTRYVHQHRDVETFRIEYALNPLYKPGHPCQEILKNGSEEYET